MDYLIQWMVFGRRFGCLISRSVVSLVDQLFVRSVVSSVVWSVDLLFGQLIYSLLNLCVA
jgi:hypothetical protein